MYIVSDASQDAQHWGAFSWTIAMTQQELCCGSGMVPGPQQDAHSGQAEGYGLLAAVAFLEKYLNKHQITPNPHSLLLQ